MTERVLTIGTFDVLHVGHLELLRACRDIAGNGPVIVAVNTDAFVLRYKKHPPAQPMEQRIEMLEAIKFIDRVVVNAGDEFAGDVIDYVHPTVLVIGDDWLDPGHDEARYLRQLGVTEEWLAQRGLTIVYVPRTRGTSSTALRTA